MSFPLEKGHSLSGIGLLGSRDIGLHHTGSTTRKVDPFPSVLSTATAPPCR